MPDSWAECLVRKHKIGRPHMPRLEPLSRNVTFRGPASGLIVKLTLHPAPMTRSVRYRKPRSSERWADLEAVWVRMQGIASAYRHTSAASGVSCGWEGDRHRPGPPPLRRGPGRGET